MQTIKMQQQRLTDLKKTLQREFKVQALPNDSELTPPAAPLAKSSSTPQGLNHLPEDYVHHPHHHPYPPPPPHHPPYLPRGGMGGGGAMNNSYSPSPATLPTFDTTFSVPGLGTVSSGSRTGKTWAGQGNHKLEYQRDINFEYLRHVVLKWVKHKT